MQLVTKTVLRALRVPVVVVAGSLALSGCSGLGFLSDAWSRSQVDLVQSFASAEPRPDWPYLDLSDETAQTCGASLPCVQAVGNDYLSIVKFASNSEAAAYAATLGDNGKQIDPLVVQFRQDIPSATREEIIRGVEGVNASSPG